MNVIHTYMYTYIKHLIALEASISTHNKSETTFNIRIKVCRKLLMPIKIDMHLTKTNVRTAISTKHLQ